MNRSPVGAQKRAATGKRPRDAVTGTPITTMSRNMKTKLTTMQVRFACAYIGHEWRMKQARSAA